MGEIFSIVSPVLSFPNVLSGNPYRSWDELNLW